MTVYAGGKKKNERMRQQAGQYAAALNDQIEHSSVDCSWTDVYDDRLHSRKRSVAGRACRAAFKIAKLVVQRHPVHPCPSEFNLSPERYGKLSP